MTTSRYAIPVVAALLLVAGTSRVQAKRRQGTAPTQATPATRATQPAAKSTEGQTTARRSTAHRASGSGAAARTRSASARRRRRTVHEKAQTAPTPERISEIQSALAEQGAYQGAPTGRWDDATVQALRQFQSAHGLPPTGKLDALSLQKLGLGSDVAGAGAPLAQRNPQPDELAASPAQIPAAGNAPDAPPEKTAQAGKTPLGEKAPPGDQAPASNKPTATQVPPPSGGQN